MLKTYIIYRVTDDDPPGGMDVLYYWEPILNAATRTPVHTDLQGALQKLVDKGIPLHQIKVFEVGVEVPFTTREVVEVKTTEVVDLVNLAGGR